LSWNQSTTLTNLNKSRLSKRGFRRLGTKTKKLKRPIVDLQPFAQPKKWDCPNSRDSPSPLQPPLTSLASLGTDLRFRTSRIVESVGSFWEPRHRNVEAQITIAWKFQASSNLSQPSAVPYRHFAFSSASTASVPAPAKRACGSNGNGNRSRVRPRGARG